MQITGNKIHRKEKLQVLALKCKTAALDVSKCLTLTFQFVKNCLHKNGLSSMQCTVCWKWSKKSGSAIFSCSGSKMSCFFLLFKSVKFWRSENRILRYLTKTWFHTLNFQIFPSLWLVYWVIAYDSVQDWAINFYLGTEYLYNQCIIPWFFKKVPGSTPECLGSTASHASLFIDMCSLVCTES